MKRFFLLFLFGTIAGNVFSQTLFTYGPYAVSADEFKYAYSKNKIASDTVKNDLKTYLDLYTLFKLKVQDARDLRLDTLPALQADLQNYKLQIEKNYLLDNAQMEFLVNQALQRSRKDVRVISYRLSPDSKKDSSTIVQAADRVLSTLRNGEVVDTKALEAEGLQFAKEDLGFITAFTLPWEIENVVYDLSVGSYSGPMKFNGAYYIFYKQSERPAAGKVKVAQILLAFEPGRKNEARVRSLADSLYQALKKGADFAALAKTYSDDRNSYFRGGELPEFTVGKYTLDFENQAFALKHDGDISKPFLTDFGYHILKRISATPFPVKDNEEVLYHVRQEVLADDRAESARQKLLASAREKTGFHALTVNKQDLYKVTDTSLWVNKLITSGTVNQQTVLFTFNDGSETKVSDWDLFLRNSGKVWRADMHESYKQLWPDFEKASILANYQKRLETFDTNYVRQLKEFEEGNMLFEVMQEKVWQKASEDTAGLLKLYMQQKDKYKWKASADVVIFSCSNEAIAKEAKNALQKETWKEVVDAHHGNVIADSARYDYSAIPLPAHDIRVGISDIKVNRFDGTATFVQVVKTYPSGLPMSFEDARGAVIDEYQKLLEKEWTDQLKAKYPIRINQRVYGLLLSQFAEKSER